jgi:uracil phosphoribosyltransferase
VHLVQHPIAQDALLQLRSKTTDPGQFRTLAARLSLVLAIEATRDLACESAIVETPLENVAGMRLRTDIVVVPVLRAGLGMLYAVLQLLPEARVGHVGLQRDEQTAVAGRYYLRLPPIDARTTVLVIDPMLATGGSAHAAVTLLEAAGAQDVRLLCIVAAPEGLEMVQTAWPHMSIHTAAIDRELDARKFILPGLGDFGDRLYGT